MTRVTKLVTHLLLWPFLSLQEAAILNRASARSKTHTMMTLTGFVSSAVVLAVIQDLRMITRWEQLMVSLKNEHL